jgi:outer membrane lipoprotein-sorting protein
MAAPFAVAALAVLGGAYLMGRPGGAPRPRPIPLLQDRAYAGETVAAALIQQALDVTRAAQTMQADVEEVDTIVARGQRPGPHARHETLRTTGTAIFQRPNLARMELHGSYARLIVSDGSRTYYYSPQFRTYRVDDPGPTGHGTLRSAPAMAALAVFWDVAGLAGARDLGPHAYCGRQRLGSEDCDVVASFWPSQPLGPRWFISRGDHVLRRVETDYGGASRLVCTLTHVRLNPPVDTQIFAWRAPPGAHRIVANSGR